MNEKTKEICILGGLYFVIGYIIDLVDGFASNLSMIFDILSFSTLESLNLLTLLLNFMKFKRLSGSIEKDSLL